MRYRLTSSGLRIVLCISALLCIVLSQFSGRLSFCVGKVTFSKSRLRFHPLIYPSINIDSLLPTGPTKSFSFIYPLWSWASWGQREARLALPACTMCPPWALRVGEAQCKTLCKHEENADSPGKLGTLLSEMGRRDTGQAKQKISFKGLKIMVYVHDTKNSYMYTKI